jgi:hypothetical protein
MVGTLPDAHSHPAALPTLRTSSYPNSTPHSAASETSDRNALIASRSRASIRGTSGSGRVAPDLSNRQTAAQKQKMLNTISALESATTIHIGINPASTPLAPAPLASENSPVLIQAL